MKLPLSWLREFVSLTGLTPEGLAEKLTLSGSEVETIRKGDAKRYANIVVGEIRTLVRHPNAEKLRIAKVEVAGPPAGGAGSTWQVARGKSKSHEPRATRHTLSIVCGAPNIEVGQKVPVALPGARLPSGQTIERATIRGSISEGMLVSGKELGISEDHMGIHVLGDDVRVGDSLSKALGLTDTVLELDITPNRGDCLSILGLAREVSALLKRPLKVARGAGHVARGRESRPLPSPFHVRIREPKLCPKYGALLVRGVRVGESPQWLQNRLRAMGTRPINNIVDVTNHVLFELGNPMHAFDFNKLSAEKRGGVRSARRTIVVRRARRRERLVTLDGEGQKPAPSMLVIADSKGPLALAGVMGGRDTEVTPRTRNILLEAAVFDPTSVRRTSKRLGLRSESSYRFERGVDPAMVERALHRAAELITELAGGKVIGDPVVAEARKQQPRTIRVDPQFIRERLGVPVSDRRIREILTSLGFTLVPLPRATRHTLTVTVPSWRGDVRIPEDLVEEVGRIANYNTFRTTNLSGSLPERSTDPALFAVERLKDSLVAAGYTEVHTYSFYGMEHLERSGVSLDSHLVVANPVSPDQTYLRRTLEPRLFEVASRAIRDEDRVAIFEIGRVFLARGTARRARRQAALPRERKMVTTVFTSKTIVDPRRVFYELKGALVAALERLGVSGTSIQFTPATVLAGAVGARVLLEGREVGELGVLSPTLAQSWKLPPATAFASCDLERIIRVTKDGRSRYTPIPHYPAVKRDLAILISRDISYERVRTGMERSSPLLRTIELFDVYEGEELARGKRSLAFHISFGAPNRTLSSEEADRAFGELTRMLRERFGAELR